MPETQPLPVVIGTAGHIDHGKSALIEALTGTHPDRWREEQERGITLDLGYAQLAYEDGLEIGFVDVPGHERLVRKMVAGATGMGAAMLVVACDDGVMPQTREHFEVLRWMGVDLGLLVLSKADLADEEMRSLVAAEAADLVSGSSWEGCGVLAASAVSGEGIPELRSALRQLALAARSAPDPRAAFRLPVQRSFALHGPGTVATGIVAAGRVRAGDEVEVLPAGRRSRVRRVQVHGRQAGEGREGLRTALNLPGLDPGLCPRGSVLAAPGSLGCGRLLRARITALPGAPPLRHGAEVQLLAHTAAVGGRVFLPPDAAAEGELLVDLQLSEALALAPGDRLLLRRPSPARNLAAGRFLGFGRRRLRRRDAGEREALLRLAAAAAPAERAAAVLELLPGGGGSAAEVAALLGWQPQAAREALESAAAGGRVRRTGGERFVGAGRAGALGQEVLRVIEAWRREHPWRIRIPVAVLRERLGREAARTLEGLREADLLAVGLRRRRGLCWELPGAKPPDELLALAGSVADRLEQSGLAPPAFDSLAAELGVPRARIQEAVGYLEDAGRAIAPADGLAFALSQVEALRQAVVEQFDGGGVDLPALRDRFATSRKFLMPLMEHLDACGVTVRKGPNRILRDPDAELT